MGEQAFTPTMMYRLGVLDAHVWALLDACVELDHVPPTRRGDERAQWTAEQVAALCTAVAALAEEMAGLVRGRVAATPPDSRRSQQLALLADSYTDTAFALRAWLAGQLPDVVEAGPVGIISRLGDRYADYAVRSLTRLPTS